MEIDIVKIYSDAQKFTYPNEDPISVTTYLKHFRDHKWLQYHRKLMHVLY